MNRLQSTYINGLESLSDQQLQEALNGIESHSVGCINWQEFPYRPSVNFHIAHSDKAIAVLFEVSEDHVKAVATEDNGPVWEDSCVETFIKDPVGEGYYNIEINCIGTPLAAHRLSRTDFEHFDEARMRQIRCFSTLPREKTDIVGQGHQWQVVELIPFSLLGLDSAPEYLETNFYKCGDNCRQPHYLSWSPIGLEKPNFHCPEFFGKINLKK